MQDDKPRGDHEEPSVETFPEEEQDRIEEVAERYKAKGFRFSPTQAARLKEIQRAFRRRRGHD